MRTFLCPKCSAPMAQIKGWAIWACAPCVYTHDTYDPQHPLPKEVDLPEDKIPKERKPWQDAVCVDPQSGKILDESVEDVFAKSLK